MKIRSHLLLLAAGILVPVLAFSTVMVVLFWRGQQRAVEQGFLDYVRAISVALEGELQGNRRVLQALAQSSEIMHGNLSAFSERARGVREAEQWSAIVVLDRAGAPVMTVRGPPGAVPAQESPIDYRWALAPEGTGISRLGADETGRHATYVAVPVRRDGQVRFVLLARIDQSAWLRFLSRYDVGPDGILTLLDQDGVVIASNRETVRAGQRPAPDLYRTTRERAEGTYVAAGTDGESLYSAHSRSRSAGWTVVTGMPMALVTTPLLRKTLWVVTGLALAVLGAIGLAVVVGRRVATPVSALAGLAGSIAGMPPPEREGSHRFISEVQEVERALYGAAQEVRAREQTLARSEAQYRALVAATSSVTWTSDAAGRFIEPQPGWQAYTGQRQDQATGQSWLAALHPDDRPRAEAAWTEAVQAGAPFDAHVRIWSAEHHQHRHAIARAAPVPDADGVVRIWSGTITDVHESHVADEARRLSDARFEVLARLAPAGLFQTDAAGGWEYVNERGAKLIGTTPAEAGGLAWLDRLHQDDRDRVRRDWAAAVAIGQEFAGRFRVLDPQGQDRWLEARALPVRDALGAIISHIGVLFDVTEETRIVHEQEVLLQQARAARAEAEAASHAKDDFLGVVSHELRNPLNSIKLWLEVLRQQPPDSSLARRALDGIERNTGTQAQLIDDLLDISRIVSGRLHMRTDTVLLGPIVVAALDTVRAAAASKGVILDMAIEPLPAPVVGDAERLQQVVLNLVSNAIKFTSKEGRVTVALVAHETSGRIVVADTGEGIDPAFLPHVFDRFVQADSTSRRAVAGLGLGLSIARRLVELHGGRVWAESPGTGKGATFVVELPLAAVTMEPSAPDAGARNGGQELIPLGGLRLLVVEDDPSSREGLELLLRTAGARVTAVGSAQHALGALDKERFDVMVSDIGMPGRDGYDLIRELRSRPVELGGRTRSIALTAYASAEDRRRALIAGFDVHIGKPVSPPVLTRAIAELAPGHAGSGPRHAGSAVVEPPAA